MKKFIHIFLLLSLTSFAANAKYYKYPKVSGEILTEINVDRVTSKKRSGISPNNAYFYINPKMNLHFNKNWSVKTNWKIYQGNSIQTRNETNPERYRNVLASNRGFSPQDTLLLVEELKVNFENEDMEFYAGKFNPGFGTAHDVRKRMGIFTSEFTQDYNLREKLGAGISAFLEDSKLSGNVFTNDTTGLSRSMIDNRGRAPSGDGIAGNNGTLSSYSFSLEGQNLFGDQDWFYNLGYRSLSTDSSSGRAREQGFVLGTEYLYRLTRKTSIIPFLEVAKINNFTGEENRDAIYTTLSIIGQYSSWIASITHLDRDIKQRQRTSNIKDKMLQLSVGYKFSDNLTLDITRANLKEDGTKGSVLGATVSYLYKF